MKCVSTLDVKVDESLKVKRRALGIGLGSVQKKEPMSKFFTVATQAKMSRTSFEEMLD